MNLLNKVRSKGFWLLDSLKGGYLKKDINDIANTLEISSFSLIQKRNAPILKDLLERVVQSSKFYNKYKSYKSLDDFPVVNKLIIKENFDIINILPKDSPNIVKVNSSGSTGIPFEIYQTKRKARRNKADVMFYAKTAGYTIGDQLLFVRLWTKKYKKSLLVKTMLNLIQIDVENLLDKDIAALITKIKSNKQPKGFVGYPSGFEKICNYLDKIKSAPIDCNVKSIIATSEALYDSIREKMEYYFNAPVVSRYSNEENGILSQQMIGDKFYTINWASFHIEILDLEEDKPAKPDELGRIVVTDLYNLATPMIRYDTGDLGKFCNFENDKIPNFEVVTGRKKDILYNTKGDVVSPFIIHANLYKYPELNQFQIIQKDKCEYIFKINSDSNFSKKEEFIAFFKSYLGSDANVSLEYTNEIPLLSSGKRRTIINLYKP
ncbi:phenylacetate--CoA ligase family protein [Flavivirga rizhaonensis]|uniref:Phenylacetate--CoA ligase family protein n=1 Tax=Flavivirga rizhaonensis TaxID=2559571 RepID=A0A4V3P549_9FLAO|nr:phenylacetate--CoA ligase family protein [Flavivirga rizhaonensis]TGV03924.1 phenylacetate--CoA ligase family protein [Flavivirga rizhaonensis]